MEKNMKKMYMCVHIHTYTLSLFAVHLKLTCCESYTSVKNKINPLSSIQFFSALSSFHSFPLRLSPKHNFLIYILHIPKLQIYILHLLHIALTKIYRF